MSTFFDKKVFGALAKDDSGLTLTEFVLVSFFFLFVIMLVFQITYFAQQNARLAERYAVMSSQVGIPLDILDRYFSQNKQVVSIASQKAVVVVPRKDVSTGAPISGYDYIVTIEAQSDGKLTFKWSIDSTTFVLSDTNINVKKDIPLFTFYDLENKVTTTPANAASVKINIVSSIPGSAKTVDSQRTVMFRNAQ